ncbi:flagellar hook-length control protein FliK [Ferrimonas balearica]|uniref:flagellar hook-length control protein FliK n=1 Tax=Ferrimonas balearica TaxID=44012 RepID=UPI001C997DC9|nr:flagellar hook-length control protein FliK [Ferrimonas balearica]MBY5921274.1 flagellar hook-length control protein FliK [Ferrimonas balearica]MBY5996041.1 flagellar hook-length control protein FliK [Ferrimonas balearica]
MIPISGSASVHPQAVTPQVAQLIATTSVRLAGTTLLIQTAHRTLQFQAPAQPLPPSVALQSQAGQWIARPLLAHGSPQPTSQFPAPLQQALSLPGQTLVPIRLVAGQPTVTLPTGSFTLPIPLPPGSDWWLRISDPRQWQLVRPGPGQILTPLSERGPAPSPPVTSAQGQPRPFEGAGDPGWQALTRMLGQQFGQSQLSQLPLPSLAQLAHPALLAALFAQIGQFPYGGRLAAPLGPLATLWQRLLVPRARAERSELGRAVESLSDAQRKAALASLTPMIDDLAQFQQQSQSDSDHPALYLALPYGQEREQRQLQLALQRYRANPEDQEPSWLLSLRFELSNGDLLLKARYRAETLSLDAVASTAILSETVSGQFDALRQRFQEAGLAVGGLRCRQGDVPKRLGQSSTTLTYGGSYGA